MGSSPFLKKFLILIFASSLLNSHPVIAQLELETDALYALKANFNDPFLNVNWSGQQCPLQYPTQWHGIRCVNGRVTAILLESLGLSGNVGSDAFSVFTELTTLSLRNNSVSGEVMNFSSNLKIREIDLSGNKFSGLISRSLLHNKFLESLQLQDNVLTGSIPEFNQSSLKVFDVSHNNLHGRIPSTNILQSFGPDSYDGNPELCGLPASNSCDGLKDVADGGPSTAPPATPSTTSDASPRKSSSKPDFGTIFLLFDVVGLLAVILLFILYFRKAKKLKKTLKRNNTEEGKDEEEEVTREVSDFITEKQDEEKDKNSSSFSINMKGKDIVVAEEKGNLIFLDQQPSFVLNDLLKASAEGLGKGIFGNSYKAKMEGRATVVVKRLRDLKPLSNDEFTKQLNFIAEQKHPNLLPILAYYYSKEEKLLVYRFAERGNLSKRIHGGRGKPERTPFRWNARLSVARGVARALEYLHQNNKPQAIIVPHGNLKSSNVLLDENEIVLVSDYGLMSLVAQPVAANRMVAYKSPEYQTSKKVSRKSDVWSFGCLLLEMLTGRVAAHSASPGTNGVDLCSWVHRAVREEWTAEIFDLEISSQRSSTPGMLKLLQIAIRCCDKAPEKRPEMSEIVREVEKIKSVESEEEEELSSLDQSLTDESLSTSASGIIGDER